MNTMCCKCKRIKQDGEYTDETADDKGGTFGPVYSYGYCPKCAKTVMQEIAAYYGIAPDEEAGDCNSSDTNCDADLGMD
jgi:hypothetical protein